MDHDGFLGELVIRRTIDFRQPKGPTKLGNYYVGGKRFDVNGMVIEGGQGLHFWLADTPEHLKPGMPRGQEFTVYAFSSDPFKAAGLTTWKQIPFGVTLSRSPIPPKRAHKVNADVWCADWSISCDGMRGDLSIKALAPFAGSFRTERGETIPVSGSLDPEHPHLLNLTIPAAGGERRLRLAYHTRESEAFSGVASWNGRTFGVSGARRAA